MEQQITWAHQEALTDNNLTKEDLPSNIKQKFGMFAMKEGAYRKNPTQKNLDAAKVQSVKIADMIQDWVEKDLPDETPTPQPIENQPIVNQPPTDAPINGLKEESDGTSLKDTITRLLQKDGKIYHDDLKKIMGKRNLEDKVEVEGMVLERSWAFYYPA